VVGSISECAGPPSTSTSTLRASSMPPIRQPCRTELSGGLSAAYPPVLPPAWTSLTLRNMAWRGKRYDIVIDRDSHGRVRLHGLPPGLSHATGAHRRP